MTTISLTPILRTAASPTVAARRSFLVPLTQTRNANLIPRPKRPYLLDQIIILSDGSSFKALTTSPRGVIRCTKDSRNNAVWNPSLKDLANVEEDEAGKLRKFRERFGDAYEEMGGMADLLEEKSVRKKKAGKK